MAIQAKPIVNAYSAVVFDRGNILMHAVKGDRAESELFLPTCVNARHPAAASTASNPVDAIGREALAFLETHGFHCSKSVDMVQMHMDLNVQDRPNVAFLQAVNTWDCVETNFVKYTDEFRTILQSPNHSRSYGDLAYSKETFVWLPIFTVSELMKSKFTDEQCKMLRRISIFR